MEREYYGSGKGVYENDDNLGVGKKEEEGGEVAGVGVYRMGESIREKAVEMASEEEVMEAIEAVSDVEVVEKAGKGKRGKRVIEKIVLVQRRGLNVMDQTDYASGRVVYTTQIGDAMIHIRTVVVKKSIWHEVEYEDGKIGWVCGNDNGRVMASVE
jgi:hypothetical protein